MSDRQAWLRESLPTVASVVDDYSAAFGRSNFAVPFASENGHVLGKKSGMSGLKLSEIVVGRLFPEKPEGRR